MTDIVERLRLARYELLLCAEAAKEIERLRAENEKLRRAIPRGWLEWELGHEAAKS